MTENQAKESIKRLCKLFSGQVNTEHAKLFTDEFSSLSFDAVAQGITKHRNDPTLENGFFHFGKLLRECKSAEASIADSKNNADKERSFAEIMRRQNPNLARCNDYITILAVYRDWWFKGSRAITADAPPQGENEITIDDRIGTIGYERAFRGGCLNELVAAGMETKVAASWAAIIFSPPSHFKMCLNDIRDTPSRREQEASVAA